jgi:hypothetical protein
VTEIPALIVDANPLPSVREKITATGTYQALIREGLSGPCLEISFKLRSTPVVLKTEIRNKLPRTVFLDVCEEAPALCAWRRSLRLVVTPT